MVISGLLLVISQCGAYTLTMFAMQQINSQGENERKETLALQRV